MKSIEQLWRRYSDVLLWCAVVLSAYLAMFRVTTGVWRLALWQGRKRAIDLRFRMWETQAWFAGKPVYGKIETADYPPAAYPTLWPFVGSGEEKVVRWIWAVTMIAMLAWLAVLIVRQSGARRRPEIVLLALFPFATYATYDAFYTGQLIIHTLPPLIAGLVLLARPQPSFKRDAGASALLIATLTKPTLTVPFFWTAFFKPRRLRPALLIVTGYALLTLFAASFQKPGVIDLIRGWLGQNEKIHGGFDAANIYYWLSSAGLDSLVLPVALGLLLSLAAWTYWRRAADPLVLAGAAAIIARIWMYHRPFDDLLIIVPFVALVRVSRSAIDDGLRIGAALLAAALWASLLLPRQTLTDYPTLSFAAFQIVQPLLWLLTLVALNAAAAPGRVRASSTAQA